MFSEPIIQSQLTLYGTLGCHLCELAEQQLCMWVEQGWQVELVDIADDDQLFERFSLAIPVLQHNASGALLHWPFDAAAVEIFLATEQPV